MILHVFSDIHFEHMTPKQESEFWAKWFDVCYEDAKKGAICILAGDIDSITMNKQNKPWIEDTLGMFLDSYRDVIYVPGNHEYHGLSIRDGRDLLLSVEQKNKDSGENFLHVPKPGGRLYINGQEFIGGTMWYPPVANKWLEPQFCDFRLIEDANPKIYNANDTFMQVTLPKFNNNSVVVTHHMPFKESIAPQWEDSPLNPFFYNHRVADVLTADTCPKMWIHGHTHNPMDYKLQIDGKTVRVYANPFGYPNEGANPNFWDRVRVEI